jgi:GNAT superfamily N-acetyltransferase
MTVRHARPEDRDRVVALLRESHAAAGFTFPFQAAYADRLFRQHLASPLACAIVAGDPVLGILLAVAYEHPFGAGRIAKETVWFVSPKARGRLGLAMLEAYEAWARSLGCTSAGMASLSSNDVSRIFERRGYAPIETHFAKPL